MPHPEARVDRQVGEAGEPRHRPECVEQVLVGMADPEPVAEQHPSGRGHPFAQRGQTRALSAESVAGAHADDPVRRAGPVDGGGLDERRALFQAASRSSSSPAIELACVEVDTDPSQARCRFQQVEEHRSPATAKIDGVDRGGVSGG